MNMVRRMPEPGKNISQVIIRVLVTPLWLRQGIPKSNFKEHQLLLKNGWLHTGSRGTQCSHSNQHHTTDIGNDDDNNNSSSLSIH